MIDLHTHSNASDGQYSPNELVKKAKKCGLSLIALTDHDTTDGLNEAETSAKIENIKLLKGIELNIDWPFGEFHLLGLGFRKISDSLRTLCDELQKNRENRNFAILEKLNENGFNLSYDEIKNIFPFSKIGRPHIAAYLVEKKIVRNRQDAFQKYLGQGRSCYVRLKGANLNEAVQAILDSDGAPVIAHPLSLYLSWGKIGDALKNIFEQGVVGLEAFHPSARLGECKRLESLARNIGFFITAGSDFHGEKVRADRRLGHTAGDEKIDDSFYTEKLKSFLEKNVINVIHR
ncbi:MAG: PHP domain-containing protein [Treponema sp.]|nr:PHP domain-containing protein [Treponema sp.]